MEKWIFCVRTEYPLKWLKSLVGLLDGYVFAGLFIEDAEELGDAMHGCLVGEKRVRAPVDDEGASAVGVLDALGRELPAETPVLLEEHEVDVVAGLGGPPDLVRGSESGDSATDDDDPLHGVMLLCQAQRRGGCALVTDSG